MVYIFILYFICMMSACSAAFAENNSNIGTNQCVVLNVDFAAHLTPHISPEEKIQGILARQSDLEELHMNNVWLRGNNQMEIFFKGSFPKLRKFSLRGGYVENWSYLNNFAENLEELSLRNVLFGNDADVAGLMNLPSLRILQIEVSEISRVPIKLSPDISIKSLEKLMLGNIVDIETFPFKTFAPHITHLFLLECYLHPFRIDDFLASIASLERLETFYMGHVHLNVNNYMLNPLKTLPSLRELTLRGDMWDRAGMEFSGFHALEKLDLSCLSNQNNLHIYGLHDLPKLETLCINGNAGWTFAHLINLGSLLNLNIVKGQFSNCDFRELACLSSLRSLNINYANFAPENIEQILYVTLPNLEELFCNHTNIRGAQFATFVPNLKRLTLQGSNITGGDLAQISQLVYLQSLDLESTKTNAASIKKLASLRLLKELSLANTDMSKVNFADLPESLDVLNLSGSYLSLTSFATLHSLTKLKKLDLRGIQNANIQSVLIDQLKVALPNCEILYM